MPNEIGSTAVAVQTPGADLELNLPRLSVIVPVYNSVEDLRRCLAALAQSEFDDFDVLVVDDGSTELIEPLVTRHRFRYMRIDGPGGPARARNRGAALVNGQYLVFIDADVCVHSDTLRRLADNFATHSELAAVIGTYDDAPAKPSFLSQYKNIFHHYVHQSSDGDVTTFWSGCGAMRRDLFLEFGGFDEVRYRRPAIEDIELGTWMSAAGHRIILDKRVRAKHLKRWTLANLLKTDILDRGIPWTRLMLRAGAAVNTLNVKTGQRISVALVYLTALFILASFWQPLTQSFAAASALAVTAINFDFYRYFMARKGVWFTLRVVPLHWLYFLYCGISVVMGTLLHYLRDAHASSPDLTGKLRRDMQAR
jgi:glycosyltransferase involved in cell wall biosynthesis